MTVFVFQLMLLAFLAFALGALLTWLIVAMLFKPESDVRERLRRELVSVSESR